MIKDRPADTLLKVGFTLVLLGYFLVWLPQPVVGLSFIGLEMGEWIKFVPQVADGEIAAGRNLFYLPPISLGLILILWTVDWQNRRWQTWAMRILAIFVAMLTFPALEAIRDETPDQWLLRIGLVFFVTIMAFGAPLLNRITTKSLATLSWFFMALLALLGVIFPSWAYFSVLPAVSELFGERVGVGPGVWLNGIGNLLIALVALNFLGFLRFLRVKAKSFER